MSKIYYFGYPTPTTGGDVLNIEHVTTLQDCGFPAQMVYPGPRAEHEKLPRNSIPLEEAPFSEKDYLVIPENDASLFRSARAVSSRVIIHNLNTYYFLGTIGSLGELDRNKFDTVICASGVSAKLLVDAGYAGSVHVIHPGLPDYFVPAKKQLRITFAPGKLPVESAAVMGAFRQMFPQHASIEWCPVMNLERRELAKVLSESAVYAAFCNLESLSLSILEAMKSGCIVVGDYGGGGAEYATKRNGMWVRADDIVEFSKKVSEAVELFLRDGENNRLSAEGMRAAQQFSSGNFREQLTAFWSTRCVNR